MCGYDHCKKCHHVTRMSRLKNKLRTSIVLILSRSIYNLNSRYYYGLPTDLTLNIRCKIKTYSLKFLEKNKFIIFRKPYREKYPIFVSLPYRRSYKIHRNPGIYLLLWKIQFAIRQDFPRKFVRFLITYTEILIFFFFDHYLFPLLLTKKYFK